MMKAEELRIGNWLQLEGKPVQVESIDPLRELPERNLKCSIQIKEWLTDNHYTFTGKWLNRFEPILLTPEWLDRLGFEKKIDSDQEEYWVNNYIELYWYEFHDPSDNAFYHLTNSPDETIVRHVHNIQNLFFALTGKELDLKEPTQK